MTWGTEFNADDAKNETATGIHTLLVSDIEFKDTKSGKGIKLSFQIAKGPKKGLFVSEFINHVNQSAQCQAIGRRSLDAFAKALGFSGIEGLNAVDPYSIKNKIFEADLKEKDDGEYGIKTVVKKYIPKRDQSAQPVESVELDDSIPF
jgi:hypothetical protein